MFCYENILELPYENVLSVGTTTSGVWKRSSTSTCTCVLALLMTCCYFSIIDCPKNTFSIQIILKLNYFLCVGRFKSQLISRKLYIKSTETIQKNIIIVAKMKSYMLLACVVMLAVFSVDAGAYLDVLKINAPADKTAPVKDYGNNYGNNKRRHVAALQKAGLYDAYLALAVAIGMQETNTFDPADYDHTKTGDSTNYSAFNFNRDMMTRQGIQLSNNMNTWAGIDSVAAACKKMVTNYGVNGFLNYERGGYQAWKDGVSYDAAGYRNSIASIVRYLENDRSLLTDNRRVEMSTPHQ